LPLQEPSLQVAGLAQRSQVHPVRQVRGSLPLRGARQGREIRPETQKPPLPRAGCEKNAFYCVANCPTQALTVRLNPVYPTLGDYRWSGDLLLSTWWQAEFGALPYSDLEYRIGASGGGFDKLRFLFPPRHRDLKLTHDDISLELELNRRGDGRPQVRLAVPWYSAGMSFGSVSINTILSRLRAAVRFNTLLSTGEGGYPEELYPYDHHVVTQVATGLFGVREDTIQRVRMVEFKYAQGAKPGLGGHLLGDKVTPAVARMRESVPGSALFSPFPFHSVYSVEDHKKHLDWIKEINPRTLVSVKVSTPTDVDMVAVGSYYAGAHVVQLDGSYGGTGAAPDIAKKNIAMPIEFAIPKVHQFLQQEGIREHVTLIARGHPHRVRHRQGHRPGRGRRPGGHRGNGGPGVPALLSVRKRPGLCPGHRHHRPGIGEHDDRGVGQKRVATSITPGPGSSRKSCAASACAASGSWWAAPMCWCIWIITTCG
jgi:hypothetical protein